MYLFVQCSWYIVLTILIDNLRQRPRYAGEI